MTISALYLKRLYNLPSSAQKSVIGIYRVAHHPHWQFLHILMAFKAASTSPALAKIVIENMSLRLAKKHALRHNNILFAQRIENALLGFHTALDTFYIESTDPQWQQQPPTNSYHHRYSLTTKQLNQLKHWNHSLKQQYPSIFKSLSMKAKRFNVA